MNDELLKLTNAVYKVLEFFPESDPLKNRAKDKALAIMSAFDGGKASNDDIDILLGYLWIAKSQGWLNSFNYIIIANGYENIKKQPPSKPTEKAPNPVLNDMGAFSDRQKKIIDFLSKNEKGQVMDLQMVLPKITKRTIRRDLDELLKAGKIVRAGEFNQVFYKISA